VLRKHLQDRCAAAGFQPEWLDVILDLNSLQKARLTQNAKAYVVRRWRRASSVQGRRRRPTASRHRRRHPAPPIPETPPSCPQTPPTVVPQPRQQAESARSFRMLANRGVQVGRWLKTQLGRLPPKETGAIVSAAGFGCASA
jgi:hypothetical protein